MRDDVDLRLGVGGFLLGIDRWGEFYRCVGEGEKGRDVGEFLLSLCVAR